MAYLDELARLQNAKATMRQAIIDKGVDVPENIMIEDFPQYIAQIEADVPDPENPSIRNMKLALQMGVAEEYYPVSTQMPDTYDGHQNDWIVAQYGTAKVDGADVAGVYLVRQYVDPSTGIAFDEDGNNNYGLSSLLAFMNGSYLEKCSNGIKRYATEISVPYDTGGAMPSYVTSKMFAMSATNVCGQSDIVTNQEGIMWDLWKQRTGLTTPSNAANAGRIVNDINGQARPFWLRTRESTGSSVLVGTARGNDGSIWSAAPPMYPNVGVLAACFISAD